MQVHPLPGLAEPVNALTHLLGAGAFAVLGLYLLRRARGDRLRLLLLGVFACATVFLLAASGVNHMLPEESAGRAVLGRIDKSAIFVMIAATHTPVQGIFFRGFGRWGVLALIWLVAVAGSVLFCVHYDSVSMGFGTAMYVGVGWIGGIAGLIIWRRYGAAQVLLLVLGGLVYTAGAILLGLDRPTILPGVVGAHELWHVAVLVALGLHWLYMFQHARRPLDGPVRRGIRFEPVRSEPARNESAAAGLAGGQGPEARFGAGAPGELLPPTP